MSNDKVSEKNSEFWNELCGTGLAKMLGIADSTPKSLKKFDDWYFDFYKYLNSHIPFADLNGKDVLEVGLGYGTVSQKIAAAGANYTGLDIAKGPVEMVQHRLEQNGLQGKVKRSSILDKNFKQESFDYVIAIGCLHHTGDIQTAIDQCFELLRPGGKLVFMVYYAYSYRRYRMALLSTLFYAAKELLGFRGVVDNVNARERAAYDANSKGESAPYTCWVSKKSIKWLCRKFSKVESTLENIDQEFPFRKRKREQLLVSAWPKLCGLDVYTTATK